MKYITIPWTKIVVTKKKLNRKQVNPRNRSAKIHYLLVISTIVRGTNKQTSVKLNGMLVFFFFFGFFPSTREWKNKIFTTTSLPPRHRLPFKPDTTRIQAKDTHFDGKEDDLNWLTSFKIKLSTPEDWQNWRISL